MASAHRFENYSAVQLATEAKFISWVKCPDSENDLFWNSYLDRFPSQADTVKQARSIVLQMQLVKDVMDENRAAALWENISRRIKVVPGGNVQRFKISYRWLAAAAVILFAVAGIWFMKERSDVQMPAKEVVAKVPGISPGGNRAVLTLADGRKLILDTTANGAISKQGNVTVVKLDNGQLIYNKKGSGTEVLYNTVSTPKGGQYQLVLADGSKVWLNAESSLRFPTAFQGHERRVELTGEGYFEVAHNPSKPFDVKVKDVDVRVLGTHFNINSYDNEAYVETTLLEGKVEVKMGAQHIVLNPGEQALAKPGERISVHEKVDVDQITAWKNGFFKFSNTDIQTIMRQVERWYGVEVVYAGPVSQHFNGKIQRNMNLSKVLQLLEKTGTVKFVIDGKKVIVNAKN